MDDQITSANDYHRVTSYFRHRMRSHYLDFTQYPEPEKSYGFIKKQDLIKKVLDPAPDLISVFSQQGKSYENKGKGIEAPSFALYPAYGVTRTGQ